VRMSVVGVTTHTAACRDCPWTDPDAGPNAARNHHRRTGHATTLERVTRYDYGRTSSPFPGQQALDIPDGTP
jgi:hypothetical protein